MNKFKKSKFKGLNQLRAKLTFDEGWAEKPIYIIKAKTSEKDKGISMLELIKSNFNISDEQMKEGLKKLNQDVMTLADEPFFKSKPIKWTRDEQGNIISPFDKKMKDIK